MNRENFEQRLDRLGFEEQVRKQYEKVFDTLLKCRNMPADLAESRAKKLQFMAFVFQNNVLLTENAVKAVAKPMFVRFSVKISDNLIEQKCFKRGSVPQKGLRILGSVVVYCQADEHERPAISLLDIARQLPKKYDQSVKAVCLMLEDEPSTGSYNQVMMQYEYKVMLLG